MLNFTVQMTAEEAKLTRIALVRLMADTAYKPEVPVMDNFCRYLLEKQVESGVDATAPVVVVTK